MDVLAKEFWESSPHILKLLRLRNIGPDPCSPNMVILDIISVLTDIIIAPTEAIIKKLVNLCYRFPIPDLLKSHKVGISLRM